MRRDGDNHGGQAAGDARGRVWVVQDHGKFDLTPAEEFGELIRVLPPRATPFEAGAVNAVRSTLSRFDARRDWLLLTGNPVLLSVAAIAASRRTGRLRALQWDRFQQRYLTLDVDVGEPAVVTSDEERDDQWTKDLRERASKLSSAFATRPKPK